MISKFWCNSMAAGLLSLVALCGSAGVASAQTASPFSSVVGQPTDLIVLAPGGAAYVASNTGLYYLPTPAGAPVLISGARQYRELAMLPDGSLLGGSTNGGVYRYNAGCTTLAGCGETLFVALGTGGGVYGVAVDPVNSYVFISGYDGDIVRRTDLTGAGITTFATAAAAVNLNGPSGLEVGTDGFLYVGDSDNLRIVRYPTNCVAPCASGTVFASGGGMTSTRGLARSPTSNIMFISDGGALGSGKVYTVGPAGGTPVQYSALAVNGIESIYLDDATTTLYVSGGVGGGSPNTYEISVAAAPSFLVPTVPTLTEWAMILLALLLAGGGGLMLWRRQGEPA